MSTDVEAIFLEELARIAPEADLASLDRRADLREALDIDSMDLLNLLIALHDRLGVEIPERDVGRLATLDGAVAYLAERAGGPG